MIARGIAVLLLTATLLVPLWAQSQTCMQTQVWGASGGVCSSGLDSWNALIENYQATFGGAGPNCAAPVVYQDNPDCSYRQCSSTGWTCRPSSPPVGGHTCPDCGAPISLADGDVSIQETDVRLPGLGGGLTLTRTYNSTWPCFFICLPNRGMFGTWRSTYEESLSTSPDGSMMEYWRADGSIWSFAFYGSPGVFHLIGPSNLPPATLTEQGTTSPTWTITFQNGEQRVFNSLYGGPLSAIIDRNGNTTTLTYTNISTGSIPVNVLTSVTDPAGRHLNFTYASPVYAGVVSTVTSDQGAGINVSYTYAMDSSWVLGLAFGPIPILTQVTQSDNTTLNFAYDADLNITEVTDTNTKVVESHVYSGSGCNAGLTSARAGGIDAVTLSFQNINVFCSPGGVGYPAAAAQ